MAEKLCTLRTKGGGGGRYTETSLWTNQSPSSDFAGQEVTLSDSIENYKYIKINYAYATSYNTGKCNTSIVVSVDDFKNMTYSTNDRHNIGALSVQNQSNTAYNRILFYVSNTAVRFGTCYQQGTNTASNANSIPLEILGLNELDHGVRPTIPYFGANVTGANTRSAATLKIDTEDYDNLTIGSVTKDSGITVKNAQIRDANNTLIYTINVSNSMQTFDVSNYSVVIIVLDAQGTTAWTSLVANNISLSK